MERSAARRSLLVFSVLTLVVSAALQFAIWRTGKPVGEVPLLILALMWTPGVMSIFVRGVRREGFRDVSFRFGGRAGLQALAIVFAYPIIVGAVAYGLAWVTGLATFAPPASTLGIRPSSDVARFLVRLAVMMGPGTLLSLTAALGEEIGWRGFFVLRLVEAGVKRPLFVSGLVWGLWHVPLILAGQYAAGPSPLLSSGIFLLSIMPASYLYGWSRLSTGSMWPAAFAHAAWNAIIQGAFDAATQGSVGGSTSTNIWVGESGILVAAMSAIVVVFLLRRPFAVRPSPANAPVAELSLRTA